MLDYLTEIVKKTGQLILDRRNEGEKGGRWVGAQFKSKVDKIAHRELKRRLNRISASVPVISEEDTTSLVRKRPNKYWLIDPLDGTASFAQGFSGFVTQAAFMRNASPELAAIYAPALGLLYAAESGKGVYLNGKKLLLLRKNTLETMIDNYPEPRGIAEILFKVFKFNNYVECGSISLKICKIADGSADLFIKDVTVRDWDLAAPYLVLKEAGGSMTDINGGQIKFNGDYSHKGLIASSSAVICGKIAKTVQTL